MDRQLLGGRRRRSHHRLPGERQDLVPRGVGPISGAGSFRLAAALLAAAAVPPLAAQTSGLHHADSALVAHILLAEEWGDPADSALSRGAVHSDPRIRRLAWRAEQRIRDTLFTARDSLSPAAAPPVWPEPAWRLRYRALAGQGDACAVMRGALADSAWQVRLRAADLVSSACARDDRLVATLVGWIDSLPASSSRERGGVSWHAGARALAALARVRPAAATPYVHALATHDIRHVRRHAARAAAIVGDAAVLRRLARDGDANVRETAIDALSELTGHTDDSLFIAALESQQVQVVRSAALALAGSPHDSARRAADAAFRRWASRPSDTERDVRQALLAAAGRPASDDPYPPVRAGLPPDAVALALGADVRLRVTMADSSGGGSFVVRLRGDVAPLMAGRVLELARGGFYDGLTWHRVDADFVIQGGSPGENEYVGHHRYFRDELATVPHLRGTVGMSTRGHDTGDAQWFVNLKDNLRLGRAFTVFAEVVDGIEVVDAVLEGDVIDSIEPLPR